MRSQKQQALGRCSPGLLHLSGDMDFFPWPAWNGCPRRRPGITAKDWARKLGHRSGSGKLSSGHQGLGNSCSSSVWASESTLWALHALSEHGPVTGHAKTRLRAVRACERTRQESYGLGFFKAWDCSCIVSALPPSVAEESKSTSGCSLLLAAAIQLNALYTHLWRNRFLLRVTCSCEGMQGDS